MVKPNAGHPVAECAGVRRDDVGDLGAEGAVADRAGPVSMISVYEAMGNFKMPWRDRASSLRAICASSGMRLNFL
jgi:hypothetical protein